MNYYLLLPLVLSFISLVLIVLVLKGHYRSYTHRLFAFLLFGLVLGGVFIFFMRSSANVNQAYS